MFLLRNKTSINTHITKMKFRHVVVDSLIIVAPIVCGGFVFALVSRT